ncbi:AraC family transcriptional regulator [Aureispira anguillae]|uniref:AraC family transcriptional regulator n=1 Tax=Aureispira anguillae TaxID=2864201 RepID=A0A916DVU4_9BACT|nr:AraC family transcriptional regulator [Aureispira anguillae]BDS14751.1 AraC family transcriptional regulator [Aureispira anguillae]
MEKELEEDYISRINKVIHYIEEHLEANLSLEKVAKIAHYSPFHFHRIFKAVTNETLNAYLTRKRIEKVASILMRKKQVSITSLALQYGFSSNSSFSRTFKRFYGVSPRQFRHLNPSRYSKICQLDRKNGQVTSPFEAYICNINNHKKWIKMNAKIDIKELPARHLAFITHIGSQGVEKTFGKLLKWARSQHLLQQANSKLLRIFHDSYKITAPNKVRMSVCITLDSPIEVGGEIGLTSLPKGKFIVGRFEIGITEFEKSWSSLFIWMGEQGYQKADQDPFELYHNNFEEHPEKKFIVDLCIPIE